MSGEIFTLTSEDNHEYRLRKTPCKYRFKVKDGGGGQLQSSESGFAFYHAYITAIELHKHCLPLDANPREPTRADVVKKMEETLRTCPEKFHHRNNGITVIGNSVSLDDGYLEVDFLEGEGICNGGHTYFSIVTFPENLPEECLVHIEFIVLPPGLVGVPRKEVINDIAAHRNRNRALMPTTQADFLGYYGTFRSQLGTNSKYVSWHEGDSDADSESIKSELLVRLLASLDPFWFYHSIHSPGKANHKQAATSSASIHRTWFDGIQNDDPEASLKHMAPLVNDVLFLRDLISSSLKHDNFGEIPGNFRATNFYREWVAEKNDRELQQTPFTGQLGHTLPNPALIMMLGAFRSNVWVSTNELGDPWLVGWLIPLKELWNETKHEYLTRIVHDFNDASSDPSQFIKRSGPYDHQLINILYGRKGPQLPTIFYDLNGTQYEHENNGTIGLECDLECRCSMLYENLDDLDSSARFRKLS